MGVQSGPQSDSGAGTGVVERMLGRVETVTRLSVVAALCVYLASDAVLSKRALTAIFAVAAVMYLVRSIASDTARSWVRRRARHK